MGGEAQHLSPDADPTGTQLLRHGRLPGKRRGQGRDTTRRARGSAATRPLARTAHCPHQRHVALAGRSGRGDAAATAACTGILTDERTDMNEDRDETGLEMEEDAREQIGDAVLQAATSALDTGRFTPEQAQDIAHALRQSIIAGLEAWMTLFYEVIDEDEDYTE